MVIPTIPTATEGRDRNGLLAYATDTVMAKIL